MKTQKIDAPKSGRIAVHRVGEAWPAEVRRWCSFKRSIRRPREVTTGAPARGAARRRHRLVAVDLPGSGDESADAKDLSAYSPPGSHTRAVRAGGRRTRSNFMPRRGSSGGVSAVMSRSKIGAGSSPGARGFVIFGTPPVPSGGPPPILHEAMALALPASSSDAIHLSGKASTASRRHAYAGSLL